MVKYDTEEIVLTEKYKLALHELMVAEMEMMRQHDPESADCWLWGTCEVGDLAYNKSLCFLYGGEEDKPIDMDTVTRIIEVE